MSCPTWAHLPTSPPLELYDFSLSPLEQTPFPPRHVAITRLILTGPQGFSLTGTFSSKSSLNSINRCDPAASWVPQEVEPDTCRQRVQEWIGRALAVDTRGREEAGLTGGKRVSCGVACPLERVLSLQLNLSPQTGTRRVAFLHCVPSH